MKCASNQYYAGKGGNLYWYAIQTRKRKTVFHNHAGKLEPNTLVTLVRPLDDHHWLVKTVVGTETAYARVLRTELKSLRSIALGALLQ